jgi:hypothetical protein
MVGISRHFALVALIGLALVRLVFTADTPKF